ncbi:hypothetical protein [Ornithinimicrobium kibberense]|uniref:hypothetical protein n=1 Tax=Ornithinimicrobium kibberense TaxID=282060 RepID=UPI00361E7DF2
MRRVSMTPPRPGRRPWVDHDSRDRQREGGARARDEVRPGAPPGRDVRHPAAPRPGPAP